MSELWEIDLLRYSVYVLIAGVAWAIIWWSIVVVGGLLDDLGREKVSVQDQWAMGGSEMPPGIDVDQILGRPLSAEEIFVMDDSETFHTLEGGRIVVKDTSDLQWTIDQLHQRLTTALKEIQQGKGLHQLSDGSGNYTLTCEEYEGYVKSSSWMNRAKVAEKQLREITETSLIPAGSRVVHSEQKQLLGCPECGHPAHRVATPNVWLLVCAHKDEKPVELLRTIYTTRMEE